MFYDAVRATVSISPVLRQDKGLDLPNSDRILPKSTAAEVEIMRFWSAIEGLHADLAAYNLNGLGVLVLQFEFKSDGSCSISVELGHMWSRDQELNCRVRATNERGVMQ